MNLSGKVLVVTGSDGALGQAMFGMGCSSRARRRLGLRLPSEFRAPAR